MPAPHAAPDESAAAMLALPSAMGLAIGLMVAFFTGSPLYGLAIAALVLSGAIVAWMLRRSGVL